MGHPGIITLTTDFGLSDPYVGMMKGVILSINPNARMVDISHLIKAGDITHAANLIQDTHKYFPKGTIHLGVVDPGVGGSRRPILVRIRDHLFIGPDNGLFWPIMNTAKHPEIIHLTENKYFLSSISRTFHGRDIFAPVAAHISRGTDPLKMGPVVHDPVRLSMPVVEQHGDILCGQVIRVDHFGNMITNINRQDIDRYAGDEAPAIKIGNLVIDTLYRTYADAEEGKIMALFGSSECLEIAVNRGRACDQLGVDLKDRVGMRVEVGKRGFHFLSDKELR